jgi:hypothetical protein
MALQFPEFEKPEQTPKVEQGAQPTPPSAGRKVKVKKAKEPLHEKIPSASEKTVSFGEMDRSSDKPAKVKKRGREEPQDTARVDGGEARKFVKVSRRSEKDLKIHSILKQPKASPDEAVRVKSGGVRFQLEAIANEDDTVAQLKTTLFDKLKDKICAKIGENDVPLITSIERAFDEAQTRSRSLSTTIKTSTSRSEFQETFEVLVNQLAKCVPKEKLDQVNTILNEHISEIVKCILAEMTWLYKNIFPESSPEFTAELNELQQKALSELGPKNLKAAIKNYTLELERICTARLAPKERDEAYEVLREYGKTNNFDLAKDAQAKLKVLHDVATAVKNLPSDDAESQALAQKVLKELAEEVVQNPNKMPTSLDVSLVITQKLTQLAKAGATNLKTLCLGMQKQVCNGILENILSQLKKQDIVLDIEEEFRKQRFQLTDKGTQDVKKALVEGYDENLKFLKLNKLPIPSLSLEKFKELEIGDQLRVYRELRISFPDDIRSEFQSRLKKEYVKELSDAASKTVESKSTFEDAVFTFLKSCDAIVNKYLPGKQAVPHKILGEFAQKIGAVLPRDAEDAQREYHFFKNLILELRNILPPEQFRAIAEKLDEAMLLPITDAAKIIIKIVADIPIDTLANLSPEAKASNLFQLLPRTEASLADIWMKLMAAELVKALPEKNDFARALYAIIDRSSQLIDPFRFRPGQEPFNLKQFAQIFLNSITDVIGKREYALNDEERAKVLGIMKQYASKL